MATLYSRQRPQRRDCAQTVITDNAECSGSERGEHLMELVCGRNGEHKRHGHVSRRHGIGQHAAKSAKREDTQHKILRNMAGLSEHAKEKFQRLLRSTGQKEPRNLFEQAKRLCPGERVRGEEVNDGEPDGERKPALNRGQPPRFQKVGANCSLRKHTKPVRTLTTPPGSFSGFQYWNS